MISPPQEQIQFSILRTAATWFRDSLAFRGFWKTFGLLFSRVFEFIRDLTPARRRLRFGDLEFDFEHRVDTTWSNIGLRTRIRELFSGELYQPIEAQQFHDMIESLGLDYPNFTFIDLGSGKGRALLLASNYPFRRIMGVEVLPELHAIAEQNIRKFCQAPRNCRDISSLRSDARDFVFPNEPTLLYLFNPFFEPVLQAVLRHLQASLEENPRPFTLLYVNPLSEDLVSRAAFLHKTGGTHQYSVFTNGTAQGSRPK